MRQYKLYHYSYPSALPNIILDNILSAMSGNPIETDVVPTTFKAGGLGCLCWLLAGPAMEIWKPRTGFSRLPAPPAGLAEGRGQRL